MTGTEAPDGSVPQTPYLVEEKAKESQRTLGNPKDGSSVTVGKRRHPGGTLPAVVVTLEGEKEEEADEALTEDLSSLTIQCVTLAFRPVVLPLELTLGQEVQLELNPLVYH